MVLIRLGRGYPLRHLDLVVIWRKPSTFKIGRETSNCSLSVDVNDGSDDDIPTDDNSIIPESGKLDTSNRNSLCSFCIIDA